jgi:Fur family peroxide stress response transcriptional regulator
MKKDKPNSDCSHHLSSKEIDSLFESYKINRTKPKLEIVKNLCRAQTPQAVSEIHHNIGGSKLCDISTVFRTINQLKEKHLVKEIALAEGFFRYEFSLPGKHLAHHHHHVRCRICGLIKALPFCKLTLYDQTLAKLGFKDLEHHLEFTGLCQKCS